MLERLVGVSYQKASSSQVVRWWAPQTVQTSRSMCSLVVRRACHPHTQHAQVEGPDGSAPSPGPVAPGRDTVIMSNSRRVKAFSSVAAELNYLARHNAVGSPACSATRANTETRLLQVWLAIRCGIRKADWFAGPD